MEIFFRPNDTSRVELVRVLGARWNGRGVYLEDGWRVGAAHVLAGEEVLVGGDGEEAYNNLYEAGEEEEEQASQGASDT